MITLTIGFLIGVFTEMYFDIGTPLKNHVIRKLR